MGEEIHRGSFTEQDFARFDEQLRAQTQTLAGWFRDGRFSEQPPLGGFELEAWLVDSSAQPAAINEQYLDYLDSPLVVPELSRFNIELNGTPQVLQGGALRALQDELEGTWQTCREAAQHFDCELAMIGILPTVRDEDLTRANMSRMRRYEALNEQVMRMRQGKPLRLDINGREHLISTHYDVMLESAATSFQIHLQVPAQRAARYYNTALALAGPLLALATNSPFLFGKQVWEETRVPLFEQAVELGGLGGAAFGPLKRVSFGSGYVHNSLLECFTENLEHYPVLLPLVGVESSGDADDRLPHLRMHNGTIWRWVRPLIGFDADGTPHLRIEQRVVPSGPTISDEIANAGVFFGLMQALLDEDTPIEKLVDFHEARDNFYAAARLGLQAHLKWQSVSTTAQVLLRDKLLPLARRGMQSLGLDQADIDHYLGIVTARVTGGQTGSAWQRQRAEHLGGDLRAMTTDYLRWQQSGKPVHEWPVT